MANEQLDQTTQANQTEVEKKPTVELAVFNLNSVTHIADHKMLATQIQHYLNICGQTSLQQIQTQANVTTVANSFALTGSVLDLILYATKPLAAEAGVQQAALMSMNLIGLFAEPKNEAAVRIALRPMLALMSECLYPENGKIRASDIKRLELHLNAMIAGDLANFLKETQAKLPNLLSSASDLATQILQTLSTKPAVTSLPAVSSNIGASAEKREPKEQFLNWATPLVNFLGAATPADMTPKLEANVESSLYQHATQALKSVASVIQKQVDVGQKYSLAWLIQETIKAVEDAENKGRASVPANQTGEYARELNGDTLEFVSLQANALNNPPCPDGTGNDISYALGTERVEHADFALPKLGFVFNRLYSSQLDDLDHGALGARWLLPFSNQIVLKQNAYHLIDAKGRKHRLPHSILDNEFVVPYEGITIQPNKDEQLIVNFGGEWDFYFQSFDEKLSFQLVLQVNEKTQEKVVLNYLTEQQFPFLQSVAFQLKKAQQTLKFAYNDQLKISSIFVDDLAEPLAQYKYDVKGNLISAIDQNGHHRDYQYNNAHQLTRYTDRTGRGQNVRYESELASAHAIEEWADDGSFHTKLKWHPRLRQVAVYDAYAVPTYYYFDLDGFTYRTRLADGREKWYSRDQEKRITRQIDFDGSEIQQAYNQEGQLSKIVQPNGGVILFAYDEQGNLIETKDPEGHIWKKEYDADGNVVKDINPLGHTTEYKYNADGQVSEIIDAKGGKKTIQYNELGQMTSYSDCSGKENAWEYDEEGTLLQQQDATAQAVQYIYSDKGIDKGQLENIVYPDGLTESFEHDQEGRLLKHIDTAGKATTYSYNRTGLVAQRIDANQHQIGYQWDKQGRIQKLINQNHAEYLFDYNRFGQLSREQAFDGEEKYFSYTENGRLFQIRQPKVITQFAYHDDGRIAEKTYTDIETRKTQTEYFDYNLNGQLSRASNEVSQNDFYRNAIGQLVREHQQYKIPQLKAVTAVLRYQYDELGNLSKTIRPDGQELSHLSYGSGHVYGIALNQKEMVSFKRDDLHRETERYLANGLIQINNYNDVGLLISQRIKPEQETVQRQFHTNQRNYHYDKNYLLTQIDDQRLGKLNYQYDAIGRLIKSQTPDHTEQFSFDPAGNLIDPIATQTNQIKNNLVTQYQGKRYTYDPQGNVVEMKQGNDTLKLSWDNLNRLVHSDNNGKQTEYGYDVFGRRLYKKSKDQYGKDSLTLFGWDGDLMVWESNTKNNQAYTKHYVYEPNSFVPLLQGGYTKFIGLIETPNYEAFRTKAYSINKDPIWKNGSSKNRIQLEQFAYYHCDQVGTPQTLSNEKAECIWEIELNTWGKIQHVKKMNQNQEFEQTNIRFQGQYYDEETGFHYNRYRYYEPYSGRYISKDPIGLFGGLNTSAYVNDPNLWVDQLGLTPLNAAGAVYGCVAGAVGGYTTGEWKGAAIGCVAGGAVGAVNPWASHAVGAAGGAGVSSVMGQSVGLYTNKKEVTNMCNYDAGAVVGAMVGGGIGGSVNKAVIQRAPYIRVDLINKPLGTSGINRTPGKIKGALLEGKITGTGELIGTGKITLPSCAK